MNKDTLIGIVGASILVLAMIGVFKYEGEQGGTTVGTRTYLATWETRSMNGKEVAGATELQARTDKPLEVAETNVTSVKFTLAWQAKNGKDTLRLTVVPPDGIAAPQTVSGEAGSIDLEFTDINAVPTSASFFANNATEAKAIAAKQYASRKGTGTWNVTVEFLQATGIQLHPLQPPIQQDEEVEWTVRTIVTKYEPKLVEQKA